MVLLQLAANQRRCDPLKSYRGAWAPFQWEPRTRTTKRHLEPSERPYLITRTSGGHIAMTANVSKTWTKKYPMLPSRNLPRNPSLHEHVRWPWYEEPQRRNILKLATKRATLICTNKNTPKTTPKHSPNKPQNICRIRTESRVKIPILDGTNPERGKKLDNCRI